MALRLHRAGPLLQPARLLRACCPPALAVLWLLVATVGRGQINWQSVTVPNGNFELGGTGVSSWGDGGFAGISNSANDYAWDTAIDVLTGWQFAAGSGSRGWMEFGARTLDPLGQRGTVAQIQYKQATSSQTRGHAAGYISSELIPSITIPADGGRFKMEVNHHVTGQARGVDFGFLFGSLASPNDVTQKSLYGENASSANKWGSPYELNASFNTRQEGATSWKTTVVYWDNTGEWETIEIVDPVTNLSTTKQIPKETFGLSDTINFYSPTEGYAAEPIGDVYTIRYYTDKRGVGEGLRLGAFVMTNSAGGTGNLYLDDFKLWKPYEAPPPPEKPASQRWFGPDGFAGGSGEWTMDSATWRRTEGTVSEVLVEGAMALFPKEDGDVVVGQDGVTVTNGMTFETLTTYTVSGGGITLGGSTTTDNTVLVEGLASATISAPIAGTAGLNKAGPGLLTLSGAGTLSGNVMVSAGTLRVAQASALGTADVFVSGGRLEVATTASVGDVRVDVGGTLALSTNFTHALSVASLTVDSTTLPSLIDLGVGRIEIAASDIAAADMQAMLQAMLLEGLGDPMTPWLGSQGIVSSSAAGSLLTRTIGYRVEDDGSAVIAFAAPGDVNLDGIVDTLDMVAMMSARKYDTGLPAVWSEGDFNWDGVANLADLQAIVDAGVWGIGNYLPYPEIPFAPVPEPAAAPLLAAAAFGLAAACRRLRG